MRSPKRRSAVTRFLLGLAVLLSLGATARAEEPPAGTNEGSSAGSSEPAAPSAEIAPTSRDPVDASPEPAPPPGPPVALDQLLRLPNSFEADVDRRGGATASEWKGRFAGVREEIEDARLQLARTEQELDQVSDSSSAWQVSAPGSNDPQTSPLSLRLRQQIKEQRARIDEAERRLRALSVEADLAAVPAEWRQ
jgi:hypothetical protein